ncbi:MAG: MotA/TolQ/ExbB proton channel family protein [Bacteroidetes Order II. Incertae sedis bacterium]|nr:MotA/TolQ/ExbB proton channel family protein [Bacteroidetes Order II. bacterium]
MPLLNGFILALQQPTATPLATQPGPTPVTPQATTNMFDLVWSGGWVMIPIIIASLLAVYVFIERFLLYRKAAANENFIEYIRRYLQGGDVRGALTYCATISKPVAQVVKKGLERIGRPITEIQEIVLIEGRDQAYKLEKRLVWLATIAGVAPLLGFLGTVLGMVEAFQSIQSMQGQVNPSVLAGGIWTALITTVGGLIVAIPTQIAYNYLLERYHFIVNQMERFSSDFIDLLQEPVPTMVMPQTTQPYPYPQQNPQY